ncbi:MAG: DUF1638 domain-containing protein [Syntrophales bacterium]|jgi:hypothetical protein|nr:DUF1638 domain-containing protein [Syntrophales bacterium]
MRNQQAGVEGRAVIVANGRLFMMQVKRKTKNVVIACRVMEPELAYLTAGDKRCCNGTEIVYLEQALHRTPAKLIVTVQQKIREEMHEAARIVLGYGLCAKGIVGETERDAELIIPRCHDCIALFLGSPDRYLERFRKYPGTYYLTPGWVAEKKDPLGIIEENVPRFGRETAHWVMEEELKHYTHIALIDTGVEGMAPLRKRAIENASTLKKQYEEIPGNLDYFRELLRGPYTDEKFLHLGQGETFTQELLD